VVNEDGRAVGSLRDPDFIRSVQGVLELYASYFRPEIRHFERLPPAGPFLVVMNHSGGQNPPDLPVLLTRWWRERGVDEPVYPLFHSFFLAIPGVGPTMAKAGGVEAGHGNAEAILHQGGIVIVFPGGDHEVFRPWRDRNRIDFDGRTGFIRLALRAGVPVVPITSCGAHESVVVLARGERIARALQLHRLRVKVWPIMLGPPFGLVPGGLPTLPLPTKITIEVDEPFVWHRQHGPETADDDELVQRLYDEVTGTMQTTLDRLAAERRFPIIG
jgi:1-acyl-sn-glycerol-3-phosphate acyltransferase